MYICIYMYVYIYTHTHTHIVIKQERRARRLREHVLRKGHCRRCARCKKYMHICIYVYVYIYESMHMYNDVYTFMYKHTRETRRSCSSN